MWPQAAGSSLRDASRIPVRPAVVLRDRNHPSILLWSLCNENGCGEGSGDEGAPPGEVAGGALARVFMSAIDEADGTRPVTANSHDTTSSNGTILAVLDVMGLTYDYPGRKWRRLPSTCMAPCVLLSRTVTLDPASGVLCSRRPPCLAP